MSYMVSFKLEAQILGESYDRIMDVFDFFGKYYAVVHHQQEQFKAVALEASKIVEFTQPEADRILYRYNDIIDVSYAITFVGSPPQ